MNPLSSNEIYGNWATLLLTTDKNVNIDFSKLNDEIDILIDSQPNGIYSNGTAGEFYAQTEDDFFQISEQLAVKCEKAGIPFQIGISHMSPQISLNRLKMIKHLKTRAVQVILPDWLPPNLEECAIFLQKIALEAGDISLVLYNPPHAKKKLQPEEWQDLKREIPLLMGVKVFNQNSDLKWYERVKRSRASISVFIPGHNLATGTSLGAQGAYSNVSCLKPRAAQKSYHLTQTDMDQALELEKEDQMLYDKINRTLDGLINPFLVIWLSLSDQKLKILFRIL